MAFVKEMIQTKKALEKMGHKVQIPYGSEPHLKDSRFVDSLEDNLKFCIENNIMKRCFDQVAESDAIIILNNKRNGIEGYIGTSALMEMGIAHFLGKKIFLWNPVPHYNNIRWAHEVNIMQPVQLNGDLKKIIKQR